MGVLEKIISEAFEALVPEPILKVSEWAAKYRFMSNEETSRPGPWRNDMVPYLVDIMDAFNREGIEKVVFLKPTQVGGTECGINILGYIMAQQPGRILYVLPDDDALREFSADRFQKVLRGNECFSDCYQESDSKNAMLRFAGGFCKFASANSPTDLASWSVPVVVMDEIDKYKKKSGNEASPLKLAEERTKNWPGKRKMFFWSTPTLKTGHIYSLYESADVRYEYRVPCPFCGEYQPLVFKQIKFDSTKPSYYVEQHAHYECCKCHGAITDKYKAEMLKKGRWEPLNEVDGTPKSIAFGLNSAYSPWVTFGQMAAEFLKSKDNPLLLMNFVNSWLGEPWENKSGTLEAEVVLKRKTTCPMSIVPSWAQLLCGGVDVQQGYLYWIIRAWGANLTSQVVAYGRCITFDELEKIMDTIWVGEDGKTRYRVFRYGIDSGFRTEEVYDYCWRHRDIAIPMKGSSKAMMQLYTTTNVAPRFEGQAPLQLRIVNGDMYKNDIANRLAYPIGKGAWMLNADCDVEFVEQITSEQRIITETGRETWVPKKSTSQNHWLDCSVYEFCTADICNVRFLTEQPAEEYGVEDNSGDEYSIPEPTFSI